MANVLRELLKTTAGIGNNIVRQVRVKSVLSPRPLPFKSYHGSQGN